MAEIEKLGEDIYDIKARKTINLLIDKVERLEKDSKDFHKFFDMLLKQKEPADKEPEPRIYEGWVCDRDYFCRHKRYCSCDIQIRTEKQYQDEHNCRPIKLQEIVE